MAPFIASYTTPEGFTWPCELTGVDEGSLALIIDRIRICDPVLIKHLFLTSKNCNIQEKLSVHNVFYDLKLYIVKRNGYFYPHLGVKYDIRNPLPSLLETSDQPSWVKEFRKAVKASTPKGWLVMQGRKESTRVQIRKDGKKIADITIPYKWERKSWPDSLLRIRSAAKAYEESDQKLNLKSCFNIAQTRICCSLASLT